MQFAIDVIVERETGKFASADSIAEALQEAVEAADLDSVGPDGDSVYVVSDVSVEHVPPVKRRRRRPNQMDTVPS